MYAVAFALLIAADPPANDKTPPEPTVQQLIKSINDRLEKMPSQDALKQISDRLSKIESQLEQDGNVRKQVDSRVGNDITVILNRIEILERDLAALRRPSTSAKPVDPTPAPAGATANVVLLNSRLDLTFDAVINGRSYSVPPGQSLTITVSAGAVATQALTTQELPQSRYLQPGSTHVVTLR